jgi:hypothetical protein
MAAHGYAVPASVAMPGSPAFGGAAKGAFTGATPPAVGRAQGRASAAPPPPPASPKPMARPAPVPAMPSQPKTEIPVPREEAFEQEKKADAPVAKERSKAPAPAKAKKAVLADDEPELRRSRTEEVSARKDADYDGWAQGEANAAASTGAFPRVADEADAEFEDFGEARPTPTPASLTTPSLGTLPGRVVLHRDGSLVLEVDVRFAFAWRPPTSLVAITADGESALVTLRATGTTAAAQLQPGMRLRLVIELPEGMPLPERLELEVDGRLLTIAPIG